LFFTPPATKKSAGADYVDVLVAPMRKYPYNLSHSTVADGGFGESHPLVASPVRHT
jgi:hypothetical protein